MVPGLMMKEEKWGDPSSIRREIRKNGPQEHLYMPLPSNAFPHKEELRRPFIQGENPTASIPLKTGFIVVFGGLLRTHSARLGNERISATSHP